MYKILRVFALFLFTPAFLFAKITPEEGSALNYRIVGFSFPDKPGIVKYKLQIAAGSYSSESAFQKHIIVTVASKQNKIVAEVPAFGKQYTWRVIFEASHSKFTNSELSHFSTMMCPDVDKDSVRMRITRASEKYKDHYVFVDCNKVLYDMKGKPVWFFPKIENKKSESIHLRDLRTTQFGTITSIVSGRLYEMNYNGEILWQGPDNPDIPTDTMAADRGYHHEFIRLPNGHYMAMGFDQPYWRLPAPPDSSIYTLLPGKIMRDDHNNYYQKMFFSTILEYDEHGKIVWKWKDSEYFRTSDLATRMIGTLFDVNSTHANAFYFDQKTQDIYISYREICRILQIHYPDGVVEHTYGKLNKPTNDVDRHLLNGLFCAQHSCKVSSDGYLYMFNNNICHRNSRPTILMLKQPAPGKDTLEKVWEFECPLDEPGEPQSGLFSYGGNVSELQDSAFFVCMGGLYGKLLIVNRDKKVLWSSQPEKWDSNTHGWIKDGVMIDNKMKEGSYRASIISRAELERVIWNEQQKQ